MTRKAVLTRIGVVTALVAGSVLGTALPAQADVEVDTIGELQAAFSDLSETKVTLEGPILAQDQALTRPANSAALTLDLAGQTLSVQYIDLLTGADLTITDSSGGDGELTARAFVDFRPAIRTTDAFLTIGGGAVTAVGSYGAAGIGGGYRGAGGTVVVTGGHVTATGGTWAAGIGGGNSGDGGSVTLSGGTTEAIAVAGGGSPVGPGAGGATFGSLSIASGATLILPEASNTQPIPAGVTVTNDGTIETAATIVNDGTISGAGSLEWVNGVGMVMNNGVITLPTDNITPQDREFVEVHNYGFVFIDHGVEVGTERVYAPTFTAGERGMPPGIWNTEPDGSGDQVTLDTDLTDETIITGEVTPLYQQQVDSFTVTASPSPVVEGGVVTLTAVVTTPNGEFDVTAATTFTTDQGDTVTDGVFTADTLADRVVTAEYAGLTAETTVTVLPMIASIEVTADPTSVDVGGSSVLKVVAYGTAGQPLGDVTQWSTFTSDVATDVFDGNRVTFPTASPHTITATFETPGEFTDTVVIDVIPAPTPTPTPTPAPAGGDHLASTGTDPAAPAYAALALLLAGIAATRLRRKRA